MDYIFKEHKVREEIVRIRIQNVKTMLEIYYTTVNGRFQHRLHYDHQLLCPTKGCKACNHDCVVGVTREFLVLHECTRESMHLL